MSGHAECCRVRCAVHEHCAVSSSEYGFRVCFTSCLSLHSPFHSCHVACIAHWQPAAQGEVVSNHDELMCNFFAQADALATGKTAVELRAEQVPDHLIPHKTFTGNRPSLSILLPDLTAFTVGQILALYENRIAVQVSLCACMRRMPQLCCMWA